MGHWAERAVRAPRLYTHRDSLGEMEMERWRVVQF